jgi:ABC-2 type transport system permease protein
MEVKGRLPTALAVRQAIYISYMMGVIFVRRNPVRVVLEVTLPFSILFILYVISGGQQIELALAGSIVTAFGTSGIWVGIDIAENRIENKLQDIFVSSPVAPMTYLAGLALAQFLVAAIPLSVLGGLIIYHSGSFFNVPALIATSILIFSTMSAIGFFVSSHISLIRTVSDTIVALLMAMTTLPPVYYAMQMLPLQLQYLAYLVPNVHAALILQDMMHQPVPQGWSPWISFAAMAVSMVAFLTLAAKKAGWRDK